MVTYRLSTNTYVPDKRIYAGGGGAGYNGSNVAINDAGTKILSYWNVPSGSGTPQIHLHERSGTWSYGSSYDSVSTHGLNPDFLFNRNIAINSTGNLLLIGSNDNLNKQGSAHLYTFIPSTSQTWVKIPITRGTIGSVNLAEFGRSVAMSKDAKLLLVSKTGTVSTYPNGAVLIYTVANPSAPSPVLAKVIEPQTGNRFGMSLSLSEDGKTLLVRQGDSDPKFFIYT